MSGKFMNFLWACGLVATMILLFGKLSGDLNVPIISIFYPAAIVLSAVGLQTIASTAIVGWIIRRNHLQRQEDEIK